MSPRRLVPLMLLVTMLPGRAHAATAEVAVSNFEFTPITVTINPGDSVRWTQSEGVHTLESETGTWASTTATPVTRPFPNSGTFKYWCGNHGQKDSGMHGTVVVRSASTSASPKPKPTTASPKPSPTSPRPSVTRTTSAPTPSRTTPAATPTTSPSASAAGTSASPGATLSPSPSESGVRLEDLPQADEPGEPRTTLAVVVALLIAAGAFGTTGFLLWRRSRP